MTPTAFGRYRVTRTLGEGAAGSVFVARDEVLGRDVAIKAIKPLVLRMGGTQRFFNEARAIAQLGHPNVVRIFDVGEEAGIPYLVMEIATGGCLKDRLQQGVLSAGEVRTLGIQIAHALAAAHAHGILHRDIKPANILEAGPGTWKLADFGVAHVPDSSATITGQFLGSPAYAAPESLQGGEFSPASDVYGLAATLFEAATGRKPHDDRGFATRMRVGDDATSVHRSALTGLDASIAESITRGLARASGDRPAAAELAAMLASDSQGAVPIAPVGFSTASISLQPAPVARSRARQRKVALVAFAIAVVALVIAVASRRGSGAASSSIAAPDRVPTNPAVSSDGDPAAGLTTTPVRDTSVQPTTGTPSRATRPARKHRKHERHDDDHEKRKKREKHDDDD